MASPETYLRAAIEAATSVDAYPLAAPAAAAPPFVVYRRDSTTRERQLDTVVGTPAGAFSVEIYCDSYSGGKDLADQIRESIDNFSGSVDGLTIESVSISEESDAEPTYLDGRDSPTYSVLQSYLIVWQE
jgi:Protein of unknown function (DUF3168)